MKKKKTNYKELANDLALCSMSFADGQAVRKRVTMILMQEIEYLNDDYVHLTLTIPTDGTTVTVSQQTYDDVLRLKKSEQKISAIKMLKDATRIGLKEAKETVELEDNFPT